MLYSSHLLAFAFYGSAFALTGTAWLLFRTDVRLARLGTVVLALAVFAIPVICPEPDTGLRAALLLCCVFPLKLWDAHVDRASWRKRRLLDWLVFLANPVALVYRRHNALSKPVFHENLTGFARGFVERVYHRNPSLSSCEPASFLASPLLARSHDTIVGKLSVHLGRRLRSFDRHVPPVGFSMCGIQYSSNSGAYAC